MTKPYDHEDDERHESESNAGKPMISTDGDLAIGIGGGLTIDTDGDLGIDIGGISVDL